MTYKMYLFSEHLNIPLTCCVLKQCRFLEQQTFVSSDNILMLVLRRLGPPTSSTEADVEFLNGAFLFHDGMPFFSFVIPFYLQSILVHVRIFQTYTRNRNWEFYWCYYISLYHNMFLPLRAILRWIQLPFKTSSRKPSLSQRIRCS
jgi:hypothetical protein